ncbi:MAG TPA: RES family NAD+ phosphorylase [Rhodothermales bacterium]
MITAWRVVKSRYAATAFDGTGARRAGGRFNSSGTAVVYTSDSLALAMLEIAVNVPTYTEIRSLVYISVEIDEALIEIVEVDDLPKDWSNMPPSRSTQRIGDKWVREARSAVLRVPSVVVPGAFNYLLNPAHPEFSSIRTSAPTPLRVDPRLVK